MPKNGHHWYNAMRSSSDNGFFATFPSRWSEFIRNDWIRTTSGWSKTWIFSQYWACKWDLAFYFRTKYACPSFQPKNAFVLGWKRRLFPITIIETYGIQLFIKDNSSSFNRRWAHSIEYRSWTSERDSSFGKPTANDIPDHLDWWKCYYTRCNNQYYQIWDTYVGFIDISFSLFILRRSFLFYSISKRFRLPTSNMIGSDFSK